MYALIVLLLAAFGTVRGFRRGIAAQVPSVIAIAIGAVASRLLAPGLFNLLYGAFPIVHGHVEEQFVYDTISSALVFAGVYSVFYVLTAFVGKVLSHGEVSLTSGLAGAFFSLFKYILFTSVALNIILAMNLRSPLLKAARSDDGNIVTMVMIVSPAVLGGMDVEELALRVQLEDAKKIS